MRRGAEARDVLGNRAGKQPVILQNAPDLATVGLQSDRRQPGPINEHSSGCRPQQTGKDFEQGRLARPGWSGYGDAFTGVNLEIEIGNDKRFVITVAKADPVGADPDVGANDTGGQPTALVRIAVLGFGQRNVCDPFAMNG